MPEPIITNPVKSDKELVRFHKSLVTKFLKDETNYSFRKRKKVEQIYDNYISDGNIRYYFNATIRVFIAALLTKNLESIRNYYKPE